MSEGSTSETKSKAKAILTDTTKCIGCERCVQGCVKKNQLPADLPAHFKADDGLSSVRYTSSVEIDGRQEETSRFVRRQCMHCVDPTCAAACLVGALSKREDGSVRYISSKCIGCRYCMLACPFSIPRYEYDEILPYIRKCKMDETCRVEGGQPACTAACPTGATLFGLREELIAEAKRRIAERPELYVDHIWGEHEFGGTSVIYISDTPLHDVLHIPTPEELARRGVGRLTHESVPHMMHGWVMVTPFQFLGGLAVLGGIAFLRRRSKVMAEQAAASERAHESASSAAKGERAP
ncbi:MAG: 4Fe-4S dicluster domain-containing protein [Acidobacteriota bacterium]|nr:MAG: 4Fe-4S dicluster domain-containing protein [Acidobacteriota bacterium]